MSSVALGIARERTGLAGQVEWIEADLLEWTPTRTWRVWHDRAVFHFLTEPGELALYRQLLSDALDSDGHAIVICFDRTGPESCSGLPVCRDTPDELALELGDRFDWVDGGRDDHVTPAGTTQSMSWVIVKVPAQQSAPET